MRFEVLESGFVSRRPDGPGPDALAVGPRLAVLPDGEIVCSAVHTSATTINDFCPVLYRSVDGRTWSEQGPLWPQLRERWSIFASISVDANGGLLMFGSRTPIEVSGESFWSEATQGLKANELIWAKSVDGRSWTEPAVIAMPVPGAAEAPGTLRRTRTGRLIAPYSPYNTFDPAVRVERNRVIAVFSDDDGRTWSHTAMLRFDDAASGGAEAWLVELSDGRLLGTAWHVGPGADRPNAFALSHDGGTSWTATRSTGILGQSTALAALSDARALFVYNQRRHGDPGVRLAVVRPTDDDFGIEHDDLVWRAESRTRSGTSGELADWGDFSFGEPSVAPLPDGTLLVALWCAGPAGNGVRFVRLRLIP